MSRRTNDKLITCCLCLRFFEFSSSRHPSFYCSGKSLAPSYKPRSSSVSIRHSRTFISPCMSSAGCQTGGMPAEVRIESHILSEQAYMQRRECAFLDTLAELQQVRGVLRATDAEADREVHPLE